MKLIFDTNIYIPAFVIPHSKVDAIVTGDKEMLELKEFEGIRIMSLREYLES